LEGENTTVHQGLMDKCVQYATIMSVQGHHCFLIEQKLCNVSVPASVAKLGAWEETAGRAGAAPFGPSLQPRLEIELCMRRWEITSISLYRLPTKHL